MQRSRSSPLIVIATPRFSSPTRFSAGTRQSLNTSSPGRAAAQPHLDELLRHREAGKALFHDERRDAVRTAFGARLGVDQDHVGDRTVGDEQLAAVEHVVVAIAPCRGAHAAERVGAGARLGEAERADQRSLAQAGQVFLLLRRRGIAQQVVHAQVVVGEDAQRSRSRSSARRPARPAPARKGRGPRRPAPRAP